MAQAQIYTDTLAAYFEDSSDARQAVDALQDAGFRSAHLGIAHHGSYTGTSTIEGNTTVHETTEKGPSTWDKIKSWFGGEEPEPYADERRDRDLAQREVLPSGDRFDEVYDDTSDLQGSFTAMNIPDDRARYFSHRFRRNKKGAIVTVQAGDRRAEAESILNRYSADLGQGAANYDYSQQSAAYRNDERNRLGERTEEAGNIQLLGEVLRVHKDRVSRGDVRIRKEVVTENQSVQVPVQREELVVEHRPVAGEKPATGTIGEKEIRVPLTEERVSADKSTVVRDEVFVGKKPVEQVREVGGEVRHEELVVDDETKGKKERSA
jgi:uncharacterized protein (TIGR02271 family)